MSVINPLDDPALYNVVELGGVQSPGRVTITGHDRKQGWDIKEGQWAEGRDDNALDGRPCRVHLLVLPGGPRDFDAWPTFLATVNSTADGAAPLALDIYHPDLAEVGITSVVKATVAGTTHDGMGGQTKVVKFLEYRPPAPARGSPKGSKASAKAPNPNQAALDELARLTAEYQRTPWGKPKGALTMTAS